MEIFWWIVTILWLAGWVKELAYVDAKTKQLEIPYPNKSVKYVLPFVLLVTWPYFHFYGKSL